MFRLKTITKTIIAILVIGTTFVQALTMQGVLRDPLGRTVDDGYYSLTFRIYDAETGGEALWNETQGSVNVLNGVFSVELGVVNSLSGLSFATQYYVGISVEEGQELEPRIKLTSVPNSMAVLGVENVFPSTGNVGVGTTEPEAGIHIKPVSEDQDLLIIDNENGGKVSFDKDGNLNVFNGSGIKFSDGSTLTSAEMGGSASSLANATDVNITSTGGSINFNIGEETVAYINEDGSAEGFAFEENSLTLGGIQNNSGWSSMESSTCYGELDDYTLYNPINYAQMCDYFYPDEETIEAVYPVGKPNAVYQGSKFVDVDLQVERFYDYEISNETENHFHTPYQLDPSGVSQLNRLVIKPTVHGEYLNYGFSSDDIADAGSGLIIGSDDTRSGSSIGIYPQKKNYGIIGDHDKYWYMFHSNNVYYQYLSAYSDRNLKQNIQDLDLGLNALMTLNPVRYDIDTDTHPFFKDRDIKDDEKTTDNLGFIAQELIEVIPEMIEVDEKTGLHKVVNWEQMTAVVVKAMQELKQEKDAEIEALMRRIEALENK